jgi:hypothetical protein
VSGFPPPTDYSEALIKDNMRLAYQAAWRWSRKTGQPYDDLESVALLGLINGCRRYDPERINPANGKPYALSTVVVPFINGQILHHFRDHGHAVRYPSKWREAWGKVQRLLSDPEVPAHEVAAQAGLSQGELNEMLGSMTGTVSLDDTHGLDGAPPPEVIEPDRLAPLQGLVEQAWANLHPGDAGSLLSWWNKPHKQAVPVGPLQQFHQRLKALLGGRTLSQVLQLALPAEVPTTTAAEVRAERLEREREFLESKGLEPVKPRTRRRAIVAAEPGVQVALLA